MRTRARTPLIVHRVACLLAGAAFLWFAVPRIDLSGRFGPILPFQSTNNYLKHLIKSPTGSEDLVAILGALPENEPVAVVYRGAEADDTFLAFIVTYFAWPRKVESFSVERANAASQMQVLARTRVCATFFCGVSAPPQTAPLVRIGDGLAVAPRTEAAIKAP